MVVLCVLGVDVECVDVWGYMLFYVVVIEGKLEVVVFFANAGARLRARTRGGFLSGVIVVDLVVKYGYDDVV